MGPVGTSNLGMGIGFGYTPSISAMMSMRWYLASTENREPAHELPNISNKTFGWEEMICLVSSTSILIPNMDWTSWSWGSIQAAVVKRRLVSHLLRVERKTCYSEMSWLAIQIMFGLTSRLSPPMFSKKLGSSKTTPVCQGKALNNSEFRCNMLWGATTCDTEKSHIRNIEYSRP